MDLVVGVAGKDVRVGVVHQQPGDVGFTPLGVAEEDHVEAAPPQDVLAHAATLLGTTLPPPEDYETAEMTPMARSFYAESKRVRNDRIREELGVELLFPTYREGLAALLALETPEKE